MPASLYRLVGKPHYSEAPAPQEVTESKVVEAFSDVIVESPAAISEPVVEEPVVEQPAAVEKAPVSEEPSPTDESPVTKVTWDPAWTKTQLLQVANELGLSVTVANTKTEILAALESTKTA